MENVTAMGVPLPRADMEHADDSALPACREFACDPTAVPAARHFVRSTLAERHVEQLSDTAELLTSELVTNVLLHARTPMQISVEIDGAAARIEVLDGSATLPVRRRLPVHATTGRGLALIDALADAWGITVHPVGKTVWFTVVVQVGVSSE